MRERIRSASPFEERYGFSRAVRVDRTVHVAGTAPIPQDGSSPPSDPYDQMMLCGQIALEALHRLGAGGQDVVRTRVFITDPADADRVGTAHRDLFGAAAPAATMVVVAALLDPAWKVEIEVEAVIG